MIFACVNEEQIKGKSWSEKRRLRFPKSKQEDLIVHTPIALAAGIEEEEPQGLRIDGELNRNFIQYNPILSKSCFLGENNHRVIENVEDYNNDINDDFYADDNDFLGNMSLFLYT